MKKRYSIKRVEAEFGSEVKAPLRHKLYIWLRLIKNWPSPTKVTAMINEVPYERLITFLIITPKFVRKVN